MSFFQVDLEPRRETLGFLPSNFRHRIIIDFRCIDNVAWRKIQKFREWMMARWQEIPSAGHEAFLNGFLSFITNETVVIGEKSSSISFKVLSKYH